MPAVRPWDWAPDAWGAGRDASAAVVGATTGATPYQTKLAPQQEKMFQQWLAVSKAPFDPSPRADYDMRGFWLGLVNGDPQAQTAINASDKQLHFPDTWKTPYHATFSSESKYATPGAPSWAGDRLIDKRGNVIADETPQEGGP